MLTGGTENMSQAPYAARNARWGTTLGMDLKASHDIIEYLIPMCSTLVLWLLAKYQAIVVGQISGFFLIRGSFYN